MKYIHIDGRGRRTGLRGNRRKQRRDSAVRPPTERSFASTARCGPPDGCASLSRRPVRSTACRVAAASSLGWLDVDPAEALGPRTRRPSSCSTTPRPLRSAKSRCVTAWTTPSTSVSAPASAARLCATGAVVAANLLGHLAGYSDMECLCGQVGCLETVAAGWALPDPGAAQSSTLRPRRDRARASARARCLTSADRARPAGWSGGTPMLAAADRRARCPTAPWS